jgi:hypothetical protein
LEAEERTLVEELSPRHLGQLMGSLPDHTHGDQVLYAELAELVLGRAVLELARRDDEDLSEGLVASLRLDIPEVIDDRLLVAGRPKFDGPSSGAALPFG